MRSILQGGLDKLAIRRGNEPTTIIEVDWAPNYTRVYADRNVATITDRIIEFVRMNMRSGQPSDRVRPTAKSRVRQQASLQMNRISREMRGGTLLVYADPIWQQVQKMVLIFRGPTASQVQDYLTFVSGQRECAAL